MSPGEAISAFNRMVDERPIAYVAGDLDLAQTWYRGHAKAGRTGTSNILKPVQVWMIGQKMVYLARFLLKQVRLACPYERTKLGTAIYGA